MKKILFVICLFACCLISNNNHVFAMEQVYTEDEVLNIAFRGNVPEIMEFETIDDLNTIQFLKLFLHQEQFHQIMIIIERIIVL